MKVYGASVVKGMLYTLKTFFETYIEDFKRLGGKDSDYAEHGLRSQEEGVVTVMYPEEPMPIGATFERFRVLPMLIYDKLPAGQAPQAPAQTRVAQEHPDKDIRCTACGICAKVCPPQCIWIVQESDDKGKPITNPNNFYIDTSVCMNCGMCAEFCPFDAIKMDHQFALNLTEQRREGYLYDLEKLLVPAEYYAELHPKANAEEEATRKAEAEAKAAKEAAKKEAAAKKAAEAAAAASSETAGAAEAPAEDERAARIAAAKAKAAAAKAAKEGAAPAEGEAASAKAADPEREARIAAAKAKAAEAKAKKEAEKAAANASAETPAVAVPDDSAATAASPVGRDSESAVDVDRVGQAEQGTEKEPAMKDMNAKTNASIAKGVAVGEALAQNDPVFTDPAPSGEIGQQPDVRPAVEGEEETPPASSEGNFTTDTLTAGDEAAAKPGIEMPPSRRPVESNPALASGGLGNAAGEEFSAASAQPADSPNPVRHERKPTEPPTTPPKASDA